MLVLLLCLSGERCGFLWSSNATMGTSGREPSFSFSQSKTVSKLCPRLALDTNPLKLRYLELRPYKVSGKYGFSSPLGRNAAIPCIVFGVLATISVVMRLWSRQLTHVGWHLEDYLMVAAMILTWVEAGLVVSMVTEGGVGFHALAQVPLVDIEFTLKVNMLS